jgi:GxxExxY protein
MPITTRTPLRRLTQKEFGEIAYEVMRQVFAIHNEIGRFFDEKIYKRELAHRMSGVLLEEPIEVVFGSFRKPYFVDVLIADGAIFEFKAVEMLIGRHRAQLLNYLLLCDFAHGKLINVRSEAIEHEFVNTNWRLAERLKFAINHERWDASIPGTATLSEFLTAFLHELGTGLEIPLYEEAAMHCFGGKEQVEADVRVQIAGHSVGEQRMRLIAPGVAFKITGLDDSLTDFEFHARRLLSHADLRAIAWVNINMKQVTFTTLTP